MIDQIEKLNGAMIQHGGENDRIYLMKLGAADPAVLAPALKALALKEKYTKIFAKLPRSGSQPFLMDGYVIEAEIPGFYQGREDALFLAWYGDEARRTEQAAKRVKMAMDLALTKKSVAAAPTPLQAEMELRRCGPADAPEMADVYRRVFPSYPFPIHQPDYLVETMETHVAYFGILVEGAWVALSSAEMDEAGGNVEMTDFATLPEWRGHAFAAHLLAHMEKAMTVLGFQTAYTIARAVSPGMNITFAKNGYEFGGRLINNTNIAGQIESMNVWYKKIAPNP